MKSLTSSVAEISAALSTARLDLSTEAILQAQVEGLLTENGFDFTREVRLDAKNRIDFMVGPVGLELKIKGNPVAIYRQCQRYCAFEKVEALILVTGKSMGLPETINNKPCYMVRLGRGWL